MTNVVNHGPHRAAAVTPVTFSHEATDEPTPRPTAGERASLVRFSAHATGATRPPR